MFADVRLSLGMFGLIYLTAVIIIIIQQLTGFNLGAIGFISWAIVIVASIAFIFYIILKIMDHSI